MSDKPNKPGDSDRPDEKQAVKNQGEATPEDYPKEDGGRPDYGAPKK